MRRNRVAVGAGISVGEPPVNFGNYLRSKIGVSYRKTVRTPLGIFRSARRFGLNGTLDRAAAPILQTMADVKGLGPIGFEELLQLSSISSMSKKAEQKQCWGSQLTGKCCDTKDSPEWVTSNRNSARRACGTGSISTPRTSAPSPPAPTRASTTRAPPCVAETDGESSIAH